MEINEMVGRRQETADIRTLMAAHRLVTLTGTSGVGKTRTALHVARSAQRTYADGAWFVELGSVQDPSLVPQVILETLKVHDASSREASAILTDHLRDRHALIVLDNCEHLVDATAHLMASLLAQCARLHVLATSIQTLGVPGEAVFRVEPLAVPDKDELPVLNPAAYAAVELFATRARASTGAFEVDASNQTAVVELCAKLEGLPLGLELAAARLKVMTIHELVRRLDDQFRLLAGTSSVSAPRHQTMLAAVTWSHELCTEAEQVLWRRMSVFPGTFTLAAAEVVGAGATLPQDEVMDALLGLVEKSVVRSEERNGQLRFSMLATIRAFGSERLAEAGETEILRQTHCDWIAGVLNEASSDWFSPRQLDWTRELALNHPDIRTALEFCSTDAARVSVGQHMAGAVWFHWVACGHLSEGRLWLERLLAADTRPTAARTLALGSAAFVALLQGDVERALQGARECEDSAVQAEELGLSGYAAHVQALCAFLKNEPVVAATHYERARHLYMTTHPLVGLPLLLDLCLAVLYVVGGDLRNSTSQFQDLERTAEQVGDQWIRSYAAWGRALISLQNHDYRAAEASLMQSLRMKRPFHDVLGLSLALDALAWTRSATGEARRAAYLLGAASALWATFAPVLLGIEFFTAQRSACEANARAKMGDSDYEAAFASGASATVDQILDELLRPAGTSRSSSRSPMDLTRREHEVARLVAEGLTNQEIAERLVISRRTAEGHVENMLRKLGFRSRAQVAVWAATGPDT